MITYVAEWFDAYCARAYGGPLDEGSVQSVECRRAFYAGAQALMSAMKALGQADFERGDDVALISIAVLDSELQEFGRAVGRGER